MTALPVSNPATLRAVFYEQLHRRFARQHFDNWLVWAGNEHVQIGEVEYASTLARAYVEPGRPSAPVRVRCELFVAEIDASLVRLGDIDARLWTDALGNGSGRYMPMNLQFAADGTPALNGNNLVFASDPFVLEKTGAFNFSIDFSADSHVEAGRKEWIGISDMADNRDGVIVVSPDWVRRGPVIAEVCARKVGARIEDGAFHSGRIADVTRELEVMAADVVYLLPFYRTGFADLHTGEDVRKGSLGSLYAVKDFYQIDPELVTPPEEADLAALVRAGFLVDADVPGLKAAELALLQPAQVAQKVEREVLIQAIGRAELRALTQRAHALDKKVIFDLVLMQTSRDCPLIETHPEFYVRDEQGRPAIHQIAWLVYSDVALFDLVFNEALQDYLLEVAPYWITTCDLDGVRIDASQTVDRPFLKKIKNRIQALKPEALVLGETLCPLLEAVDVPVDMVYALMVDFHRDVERASPLNDFLEEVHRSFAPGTVAMAYFENHDSPRATHIWHEKYRSLLQNDKAARAYWQGLLCAQASAERPQLMALLKNLQAALIDSSIGTLAGTNLTRGLEWGSEWGEEVRTDFENETRLHPEHRSIEPNASLNRAYTEIFARRHSWPELYDGQVYYHRNDGDGGDIDDRILAYVRHTAQSALLVAHNLDPARAHSARLRFDYLQCAHRCDLQFDNYQALQVPSNPTPIQTDGEWQIELLPLQTRLWRLS